MSTNKRKGKIEKRVILKDGFVAGVVASLCCILPPILIGLGIGSTFLAFSLSQYRPVFVGIAVVLFSLSIYARYSSCSSCNTSTLDMMKRDWKPIAASFMVFVGVSIALTYIVAPAIAQVIYPAKLSSNNGGVYMEKTKADSIVEMKIEGMSCEGCAHGIKSILGSLNGVTKAEVYFGNSTAAVEFDSSVISVKEITKAVPEPYRVVSYEVKSIG